MKIFVQSIDPLSVAPLGIAALPSFLIEFRSSSFRGNGRLVPASGSADDCAGREYETEIGQGSISEFRVHGISGTVGIESLGKGESFRVQGVVTAVRIPSEPKGRRFTYVAAGDAVFTLEAEDMCGIQANVGAAVSFIAHDVSFWDEAI